MDRHSRKRIAVFIAVTITLAAVAIFALVEGLGRENESPPHRPRALYYDSLSREYPDPELRSEIVRLLESHGYEVDVYVNESAGLEQLRNLGEYDLVILRAHGAYNGDPRSGRPLGSYVYTGLLYSEAVEKYGKQTVDGMLRRGDLALAVIPPPGYRGDYRDLPQYIAASPQFFDEHIHAMRKGSIVIFTGCYGLDDTRLASIFVSRGSAAFIGWKGNVTQSVSDAALEAYVKALLQTGDPSQALQEIPRDLRTDPYTGASLEVYRG